MEDGVDTVVGVEEVGTPVVLVGGPDEVVVDGGCTDVDVVLEFCVQDAIIQEVATSIDKTR